MTVLNDEFIAAAEAGDAETVRALLARDAALADTRREGESLLMRARYRGDRAVTDALRSTGRPLDVFEAATFDDTARLGELLAADRRLATAWSPDGFTPLHFAAFFGGVEGARLLLDAGADANAVSRNEMRVTPLHSAAAGQEQVALLLVEQGADVNGTQRHGWTPLHSAARNGYGTLVDALLRAGADACAVNDDGTTATLLASEAGHTEIVERLGEWSAERQ